jgi:hypothetical protein
MKSIMLIFALIGIIIAIFLKPSSIYVYGIYTVIGLILLFRYYFSKKEK